MPFCNGAPNLTVDTPALRDLATERGLAISGKDFKTGQTLIKTVLAPMLKARMLGLSGWYSTNILGNRDGEVLDDPDNFKTKEESKLGVLEHILQPERYPELYGDIFHKVRINYYPPRGDNKEGWDNIDIFGWLGYPMQIKVDFLCRDSILAAPLALDLVLFTDLAQRAGLGGIQEWLSFYYKSPMAAPGLLAEDDLFIQLTKLKNTLRWIMGEDQITHLGREYYVMARSPSSLAPRCAAADARPHLAPASRPPASRRTSWGSVGRSVDELLGERRADGDAVGAQAGQEPVVVAAALAEAATVGGERQPGHDDEVERAGSRSPGSTRRSGPSTAGAYAATPWSRHHVEPRRRSSGSRRQRARTASPGHPGALGPGSRPSAPRWVSETMRAQMRAERARRSAGSAAIRARRTARISARSARLASHRTDRRSVTGIAVQCPVTHGVRPCLPSTAR